MLLALFHNSKQNLMLIHCSKNWSLIFATRRRNTHLINTTTSTQLALMRRSRKWCKLNHAQTYFYYNHITWLPLSHTIKSFQELQSQTMHVLFIHMAENNYIKPYTTKVLLTQKIVHLLMDLKSTSISGSKCCFIQLQVISAQSLTPL